jgi:excisionase family DNA binding protein
LSGAKSEKAAKNARGRPASAGTVRASAIVMLRSVLIPDAAELLGVSRRTVYYRIRAGTLKTVRTLGGSQRVLMESIEAALRTGRRRRRAAAPGGLPQPSAADGPSTTPVGPPGVWL